MPQRIETRFTSVLIVEPDAALGSKIGKWCESQNIKVILARSASEAAHLMHDIAFIGCTLDALIVAYNLQDTTGCRIVNEFRYDYPWAPVALLTDDEDITTSIWAKARGIHILRKPVETRELSAWHESQKVPA